MALQEERNKRSSALSWHARFVRERQDLSASVDATLHTEQERLWQEEGGEAQKPATTQEEALISPQLSLQSHPMPAIRLDEPDERSTRKLAIPVTTELPALSLQQTGKFL